MKQFFQKVGAFLALIFGNAKKFEVFLADHVDDGIAIASKIKAFLEGGTLKTLLDLLPAKYSAVAVPVLAKIDQVINKVLDDLGLAQECFTKATTPEKLQCFIEHLKQLTPAHQQALLAKFVSLYAQYHSDSALKTSEIDTITQSRYYDLKNTIPVEQAA